MTSLTATSAPARRSVAPLVLAALSAVLVVGAVLSVGTGPVRVPVGETAAILWAHLTPGGHLATWSATNEQIVWTFRLPRVLPAVAVGAALAVAGHRRPDLLTRQKALSVRGSRS